MKKLFSVLVIFILCEDISHSQTRSAIVTTIDTKIVNNPTAPIRAADLNAIFKSIINFQDTVSLDSRYLKIQTQSPTASITGGETRELMSSGANLSYTFNWSAGRSSATSTAQATASIVSVSINGVSQTFSNPSAGASVSGTYTGTVGRNTNTPFTITVTTSDGKTATASTSVIFQPKRYWGYATNSVPTSSDIVSALGGGSELSTSIIKTDFTITVSGADKYIFYATPLSEGHVTSILINNTQSILLFPEYTVSVTNASGYVQNYYIRVSNILEPTLTINSAQ